MYSVKTSFKYFDGLYFFFTSITLAYMMVHFVHYVEIRYFERSGNAKVRLLETLSRICSTS